MSVSAMRREERWDNALESPVRFDLAHGLLDRIGPSRTAYLLQRELALQRKAKNTSIRVVLAVPLGLLTPLCSSCAR